jgi:Ca-activated chloride channel family protein
MIGRPATAALLFVALGSSTAAVSRQVFRSDTELVVLSVTVSNAEGHVVPGLGRDSFQVFEDGIPQDVSLFLRDPQPIALSILLDSSPSMESKLAIAQEAAVGFVSKLRPNDVAQVIDFDSQPEIVQTFTNDRPALERAIRQAQPGGSTALYQSLYIALDELKRMRVSGDDPLRRQAIVVLSDGEDTSSLIDYEQVLDASKRTGACVYAIGLRDKDEPVGREFRQADFVMRTLTQETGGRVFFVTEPSQLPAVYGQIAQEIAGQYTLGYRPKNLKRDGAWRRIAVKITSGGAVARTKSGYFASKARP